MDEMEEGEGSMNMGSQDEGMGERRGRREGGRGGPRGDRGDRGGMGIKPNYFLPKPVKAGDEVEVKVEAVASKGDGIAKKDGFVIFIKGAKEGETVKVRIVEVKPRFAIGEIIA